MITIKELTLDIESGSKIIALIKKHEPKIWKVLQKELKEAFSLTDVVVPKGTLVCEHPLDKRASIKSQGKDFCWKCGKHITN